MSVFDKIDNELMYSYQCTPILPSRLFCMFSINLTAVIVTGNGVFYE